MKSKQSKAFDPYATAKAAKRKETKPTRASAAVPVMSTDDVELGYYEYYDYEISGKNVRFIRVYINVKGGKPEMVIGSGQDPMAASRTILAKYNQRNKTRKTLQSKLGSTDK